MLSRELYTTLLSWIQFLLHITEEHYGIGSVTHWARCINQSWVNVGILIRKILLIYLKSVRFGWNQIFLQNVFSFILKFSVSGRLIITLLLLFNALCLLFSQIDRPEQNGKEKTCRLRDYWKKPKEFTLVWVKLSVVFF